MVGACSLDLIHGQTSPLLQIRETPFSPLQREEIHPGHREGGRGYFVLRNITWEEFLRGTDSLFTLAALVGEDAQRLKSPCGSVQKFLL